MHVTNVLKTSFVHCECLKNVFCTLWMSVRFLLHVINVLKTSSVHYEHLKKSELYTKSGKTKHGYKVLIVFVITQLFLNKYPVSIRLNQFFFLNFYIHWYPLILRKSLNLDKFLIKNFLLKIKRFVLWQISYYNSYTELWLISDIKSVFINQMFYNPIFIVLYWLQNNLNSKEVCIFYMNIANITHFILTYIQFLR